MGSNMEAIDCASTLTAATATALKSSGVIAIGRYLGHEHMGWWKAMGLHEAQVIHDAGLALVLIWEGSPTSAGYFSYSKGVSDAKLAADEAVFLGAPKTTALYFTVDYDAQAGDMAAIVEYFRGVRDGLDGQYLVGAYGSYDVMRAMQASASPPDKYYQTYAWSGGQVFEGNHIYQYQNDTVVEGVAVDRDQIQNGSGTWPELRGGEIQMDKAVVYFTAKDYSVAMDIADLHGGCAMFCRNGGAGVHADAKKATIVYNVGGPALGWANEVYMSGNTAMDTVNAVAKAYTEGKLA